MTSTEIALYLENSFAATCNLHHCMFMKVGRAVIPKEVRSILKSESRNVNDIIIAAALIVSVHQDDRGQERPVQIIVVRFTATFESTGVSCLGLSNKSETITCLEEVVA